jgi:carbon-monoxide dehydrogenase large subunit
MTPGTDGLNKLVGARLRRREDPRLLRGRGSYVDDLRRSGLLHVAFVRSDFAHAAVVGIDTKAAKGTPGVLGVYTAEDLAGIVRGPRATSANEGYQACQTPVLTVDRVRYVGEPVCAVAAETRHVAEDGAEAVRVSYEPLSPVVEIAQALADDAPQIHEEVKGNLFNHFSTTTGDVEAAFAAADFIVENEYRSQRVAPMPLEARVTMAEWDPDGQSLTVWASHQAPHMMRTGLAEFTGLPESAIRVISPDVGGGFGGMLVVYVEDLVVIGIARLTGKPVKWTSARREDILTTMHGREQIHRISAAVRNDGRVLGVRAKIMASNGAYAIWPMTAGLDSGQASENVTGPYDIATYERDVYAVVTNKAPMGPYRGVGRVSACFSIERTMDDIAAHLGLEPLEVRRRNVIRAYPYTTPTGLTFESGSSAESLDMMEELLDLPAFRTRQRNELTRGRYLGLGVAAVVEHTALGPQEVARKGIEMVLGLETASLRIEPDGAATLIVGTHSQGQGHQTTFAQIVADRLGLPFDRIDVRYGDTAAIPYGLGTWASRSLVYGGGATILATESIIDKGRSIAAHLLECNSADLEFRQGRFAVGGTPTRGIALSEVARVAIHRPDLLPEDLEPGLEATRWYRAPDPGTFSNSLHAAIVDVDIETGEIGIERYVVIEDCGTIVNPTIVEGQLHGGIAQGLGHALLENAHYDEDGQPLATTLMDYLVPGFTDIPRIEVHHIETPSPYSLGGFKGMGEGGAINPPAVIANAVTDALAPFGIRVNHTPITPEFTLAELGRLRSPNESISEEVTK